MRRPRTSAYHQPKDTLFYVARAAAKSLDNWRSTRSVRKKLRAHLFGPVNLHPGRAGPLAASRYLPPKLRQPAPAPEARFIDVVRTPAPAYGLAALRSAAQLGGRSAFRVMAEWSTLWLRRRLSMQEYLGLRLFDDNLYETVGKSGFIGAKGARRILLQANYRLDLYGLIDSKIACDCVLGAHGLPVVPTLALFRKSAGRDTPFLLRSHEDLKSFLSEAKQYPLFGKPLAGKQSLGHASFESYDAATGEIIAFRGHRIPLDPFVRQIVAHYPSGYLLQKRMSPPPSVREICGDRLATVRVLTAMRRDGPQVLRAAWKIPAGPNAADNFWRVGNLLARLDLASGTVRGAVQSTRTDFAEVDRHPDSGATLVGRNVPQWQDVLDLAREGARVLEDLPLLGWDIAPLESGVVIVEVNQIPDLRMHQIADRRGILDAAMEDFLCECRARKAAWRRRQPTRSSGASAGRGRPERTMRREG